MYRLTAFKTLKPRDRRSSSLVFCSVLFYILRAYIIPYIIIVLQLAFLNDPFPSFAYEHERERNLQASIMRRHGLPIRMTFSLSGTCMVIKFGIGKTYYNLEIASLPKRGKNSRVSCYRRRTVNPIGCVSRYLITWSRDVYRCSKMLLIFLRYLAVISFFASVMTTL